MKLVIFDCDGVLIDSELISAQVLAEALSAIGLPIDRAFVLRHFTGRAFPAVADEVRQRFGVAITDDFVADHAERLRAAFRKHLTLMPGVRQVIDQLTVPFCLATSSSPVRLADSLAAVGLTTLFADRAFTASVVANGKPAPDLFLHCAQHMGVAVGDCLVVEDSIPGLQAGLAAGMTVWHFTGGSHFVGRAPTLPDGVKPHRIFDSFAEFFEAAPLLRAPAPPPA